MKFFEFTKEALEHWRQDERTAAAFEWLREYHRATLTDLVSTSRSADLGVVRYQAGKLEAADNILTILEKRTS
jgi:hypothetical protein